MFVTSNFICSFATIYAIETYLSLKAILIIKIYSAIISILKLKIVALYFLIKLSRLTMLTSLARVQRDRNTCNFISYSLASSRAR